MSGHNRRRRVLNDNGSALNFRYAVTLGRIGFGDTFICPNGMMVAPSMELNNDPWGDGS